MHPDEPADRALRVRAGECASIAQLQEAARRCDLCRLRHDRSMVVTGSGPADAAVLVVADAPGYHDDQSGRLLSSRAGELLDQVLGDAGLVRGEVYLTSVVHCRPPMGRAPFPDEIEACEGWLFREIALVQPRVVVTLGSLALRLVTGRRDHIDDVRGTLMHTQVQGRDLVVWPLYHPAAACHVESLAATLRADARALGTLLQGARASARTSSPAPATEHDPEPAAPVADDGQPQLALDL